MTTPWVNSERCKSGEVCHLCRLIGSAGNQWRQNLHDKFGYQIDDVMFSCPKDKEWHTNSCRNCNND